MSNIAHELFLLAVNLSQYKSKTLIVKVFVEGINTIFNPHTFEWSEEKTEDNETIFDVCTRTKKYGHIKHNKKGNFTNEAISLLQNVVQMLAVLLEKLEHEEFFNNQKEHLQQLVDKQTSDLLQRQTELQTQNEEYEALNEELRQTNDELNQLTFALQIAKEKAENNENILKEAQSLAHIGNWMLDLNQNILSWSDEIYRIFGCKPQEFGATYEAFLNFIHPDDRDFVNNAYLNHLKSKKPYNIVHRILLASGEVKYVNERCKTDFDEQGKAIRSVGTVSDITEKKIAENALQRTQYSIDNITDSIFWIDKSARLVFANQAACRNLEYSIDNLLQLTIFDIDPSFPKNKWNEHWQEILLRGSFTIETIHRTNSGKQYPVEVTTNKVEFGGVQYNCAIARDITERKIAEQELINAIQKTETSEQRLFTFINSVPDIICYKDGEGKWLLANEADLELFCLKGVDYFGKTDLELSNYTDEIYKDAFINCMETDEKAWSNKLISSGIEIIPTVNGETKVYDVFKVPVFYQKGERKGLAVIGRDISKLYETQENLILAKEKAEESEKKFSAITNQASEGIALSDLAGKYVFVNPAFCKMTGYSEEELLKMSVFDLRAKSQPQGVFNESKTSKEKYPLQVILKRKDETEFYTEIVGRVIKINNQDFVLGTVRDITEHKQVEEERKKYLYFLENLDKINKVIQQSTDMNQMMSSVLDTVLSIFNCDRAFLMYPCDPDATIWKVPMERNKPEYPGVGDLNLEVSMDQDVAETLRILLSANGPVQFGPGTHNPLPADVSERFGFKCFMSTAVCPKVGKPWQFGIHQCSFARIWTDEEERLFQEIGRRIADSMSSLLSFRDLQESEQRYRMVFENSPVSIWEEDFSEIKKLFDNLRKEGITDIENYFYQHPEAIHKCIALMKIVDVNKSALTMHSAETKQELIANLANTFSPESFDTFRQELISLWNGETEMFADAIVKTLSGELRDVTVYVTVCPGYEQTLSKILVSLVDITERRRAEEEIRKLNQELEKRVVERTSQLENANKELEAFSYSVSHDLRAPLRGIDGFSQILLDEYQDKVDEQGRNYLRRVRTSAQLMAQLIDDMLNLSRVSRREMSAQQFNLSEMVQDIAKKLLGDQSERKVEFAIQKGITVKGDGRLLRIVMENLMGNAWKFTSKNLTAHIEFGMQLQNDIPVYFVRDDGAGFDMNYAHKLFGAFQRLHTNSEFPGTGVGLATVQRVIHRHGGKVWGEGEVEKGATFYFTIN